ncbi:MAG: hypothetical protein ACRCYU_23395 [Nocardioides sp.]
MKVRIQLTVDIDPETWELVNGVGPDELRDDVRSYLTHSVDALLRQDGHEGVVFK